MPSYSRMFTYVTWKQNFCFLSVFTLMSQWIQVESLTVSGVYGRCNGWLCCEAKCPTTLRGMAMFCPGKKGIFTKYWITSESKNLLGKSLPSSALLKSIDYSISSIRRWRFFWHGSDYPWLWPTYSKVRTRLIRDRVVIPAMQWNEIQSTVSCLERFSIDCRKTKPNQLLSN